MNQTYEQSSYVMSGLTARIIGCATEVHKTLGPGFDEAYYQRALIMELTKAGLQVKREVEFEVYYKGNLLGKKRVDLIVNECLVELKAKSAFDPIDTAQTISYLKASGYLIALLINFGAAKLEIKRYINSSENNISRKFSVSDKSAPQRFNKKE